MKHLAILAMSLQHLLPLSWAFPGSSSTCSRPIDPPCHPFLAQNAPWSIAHSSTYSQGSSSLPGPTIRNADTQLPSIRANVPGIPLILAFSPPYEDGAHVVWSYLSGSSGGALVKVDPDSLGVLDIYRLEDREENPPDLPVVSVTGAYTFTTRDYQFVVTLSNVISIYGDEIANNRTSPVQLKSRLELSLCSENDVIVGASLLYTGETVVVSEEGGVFVISTTFLDPSAGTTPDIVQYVEDCGQATVSNNIAVDEMGGIYAVSEKELIRFQFLDNGDILKSWKLSYDSSPEAERQLIRLGPGSGSSPSLMGSKEEEDKLIVITDGQLPMHLLFAWRGDIPDDWQGLADVADPRIVCDVPVNFGLEDPTWSLSEQSVLVRGYSAIVVNNYQQNLRKYRTGISVLDSALGPFLGSDPSVVTPGVVRIDWDPQRRRCETRWTNSNVISPNGIPTMSEETGLVYVISLQDGLWGLQSLDFETGDAINFSPSEQQECDDEARSFASDGSILGTIALALLKVFPSSCQNSMYAATTIGHDGAIYTGTLLGVMKYYEATPTVSPSPTMSPMPAPGSPFSPTFISIIVLGLLGVALLLGVITSIILT